MANLSFWWERNVAHRLEHNWHARKGLKILYGPYANEAGGERREAKREAREHRIGNGDSAGGGPSVLPRRKDTMGALLPIPGVQFIAAVSRQKELAREESLPLQPCQRPSWKRIGCRLR